MLHCEQLYQHKIVAIKILFKQECIPVGCVGCVPKWEKPPSEKWETP